MLQLSFEDLTYPNRTRKTRNQRFREKVGPVWPWTVRISKQEPLYFKGEKGRPLVPLETRRRIDFMQPWFGLSDPGREEARPDTLPLRPVARRQPGYVPDEPPIGQFRPGLEPPERTKGRFSVSRPPLRARGLRIREGPMVDATLIEAPSHLQRTRKDRGIRR